MRAYLNLLADVMTNGTRQKNRTGIDTLMIPGGFMQFDLQRGFPLLTTKRMAFGQIKGELLAFIRGYTSAADFRKLGCTIWDANANQNKQWLANPLRAGTDDLGRIYGAQWREWRGAEHPLDSHTDQLANALTMIEKDPTSRRIIVTAWNPTELDEMALPPCHLLYQFLVQQEPRRLHMTMYMRSCDMFLGVPFNIASYALLLHLVAAATGYEVGTLTMFLADVHVYENHFPQVTLQLNRAPRRWPTLVFNHPWDNDSATALQRLESVQPSDIDLEGYDPEPAIHGEMAV